MEIKLGLRQIEVFATALRDEAVALGAGLPEGRTFDVLEQTVLDLGRVIKRATEEREALARHEGEL
jgi:hypothetical protein